MSMNIVDPVYRSVKQAARCLRLSTYVVKTQIHPGMLFCRDTISEAFSFVDTQM